MRCPQCSEETAADSPVCPSCGTPLHRGATPGSPLDEAATSPEPFADTGESAPAAGSAPVPGPEGRDARSRSDSAQHGRFLPGVTVAERYRIVGLLGRGGMGEVYRADDLKLGQQVALKFLNPDLATDPERIDLLLDEVRMARTVSHPNVCRVWDIGEADGLHYVSMEYVDGEDLASLLRRIGRLPKDKAVEIARQLCAALAAAHDEGVLHRDLKPANIMLDGRGRVKLTDFGLAGVADVRAGTPVYMAPEQLAGREVSVQSDLFSLGLVLHELFTGDRVVEADGLEELTRSHQEALTTSLSTTAELDPAVDRVIHRCLEVDPEKRPASAMAVAAGLPGADPLAAALAAGETPSPEMVAEAGGEGSLPATFAVPLLIVSLLGALAVGILQARNSLVSQVPFDRPPAVLDARAEEVVADLGYESAFADRASAFAQDLGYILWLRRQDNLRQRWDAVTSGRPASIVFWWRGSPTTLVSRVRSGPASGNEVSLSDPPRTTPGMVSLRLDTLGRLIWFDAVPDQVHQGEGPGPAADWPGLFDLMGLEIAEFTPVEPRRTPDHFADERAAWEGVFPEDPEASLRIEAAALAGRLVSLRQFTPYDPLQAPSAASTSSSLSFDLATVMTIFVIVTVLALILTAVFGAVWVARRNVVSGRGDVRGARRVGTLIAAAIAIEWLLGEHSFSFADIDSFTEMLVFVGAIGGLAWALYLAVEPFMRRHAPWALIGWTRLIDGRLSDPLVGRDLLLGCAAGAVGRLLAVIPMELAEPGQTVVNYVGLPFPSLARLVAGLVGSSAQYVVVGLALSFLFGLTLVVSRRRWWAAYGAWMGFVTAMAFVPGLAVNGMRPAVTRLTSVFWILGSALALFVLFRIGILAYVAATSTSWLLASSLPTLDLSAWYASNTMAAIAIFFGLVAYAFHRCVAWRGGLAEALAGG